MDGPIWAPTRTGPQPGLGPNPGPGMNAGRPSSGSSAGARPGKIGKVNKVEPQLHIVWEIIYLYGKLYILLEMIFR